MDEWVDVASVEEIPPGECKAVDVDDRLLAVVNVDGEFHAIDNICTHEYAELSDGVILGDEIQCPLHGARFNVRSGEVTAPPAYEPLRTYEVRVHGDRLQVRAG